MGINEVIQVGNQIRKYRLEKGLSQKATAALARIPYSTYSNYENNNREPSLEQLEKIATALEIPIWKLLGISKQDALLAYNSDGYNYTRYDTSELSKVIKKDVLYETRFNEMKKAFNSLNASGQQEAIKQIKMLTKIPEYQAED